MATAEYSFYEVFLTAEAYRNAAEILHRLFGDAVLGQFEYVIMANHALALELYLKCLLLMDRKKPAKHHNVARHFKALSQGDQDAIRKHYEAFCRGNVSMQSEYARLKASGEDPDQIFDLDNALQASEIAFEKARYPYEPQYAEHAYRGHGIELAIRQVVVDRYPLFDISFWGLIARANLPPTSPVR